MSTGERTLSPRERAVLSALIVHAGTGVRSAELADAYWGEQVPATWAQQVKTAIARIRGTLGNDSVRTVSGGYALGLDPDLIDAVRFERLVSTARSHVLHGEADRALESYRRALALWRGDAYPDLSRWSLGAAEASRLAEIRMAAEEEALNCRLSLGDHRAVIPDAERLVRAAPLREDRWALLVLANYRAGRQAEALAALRSARSRLQEDLGIDLGQRLSELETAILRQDPELDAPTSRPAPSADCPYQGLEAFGIEDSDEFFGREDETERILERLRPGTLLALAGASGSGKSSLAMAGVLRRVIDRDLEAHILRPAQLDRLDGVSLAGVVLVDQLEELFQLDPDALERGVRALRGHVEAGGTVLVTVRSDFLARCLSHPDLAALFSDRVVPVLPMSREQLQEAIERPAELAGLRIEPGLTELILRDTADHPAALPLLSHALAETWMRREAGVLTVDGYETAGGLAGAVATSAERLYQSWDAAEQRSCHAIMLRLIERTSDGASVRRIVPLGGLQDDPVRARVISALVAARLLSIDQDVVAISHETLVEAWPRLGGWLVDDAEDVRMLAAVSTATAAWEADGRSADDLLHGARLQAAIDWQSSGSPDLTDVERDFLAASRDRAEAANRETEVRAARDRRQNRQLRWAIGGAAVLLVAAIFGGGLAVVRGGDASAAAEDARIEALVATSLNLLDNDREAAAVLAAEAFRRWPDDPRTRSALWGVMISTGGLAAVHPDPDTSGPVVDMIPGTTTEVRVTSSQIGLPPTVDIVDIDTGEVQYEFSVVLPEVPPGAWYGLAVTPDGSAAVIQSPLPDPLDLVDGCCRKRLTVLDIASGKTLPGTGLERTQMADHTAFDGESRRIFIGQPLTGDVMTVDLTTGDARESTMGVFDKPGDPGDGGFGVELLDGGLVAVSRGDQIRVYDRETLALVRTIPLGGDFASRDILSDRRGGLVTTGLAGTERIDVASGEVLWRRLVKSEAQCGNLHLATENRVACGSYLGVALLDLATGETTNTRAALQLNRPPFFATIDDETILVSVELPPVWMRWRIDGGAAGAAVVAKGRELIDGPERDGSLVVTRPEDGGRMRLWDFERDVPVGGESDRIVLLGSGIAARYDGSGRPDLERIASGERIPLRVPDLPREFDVRPAGWARPAFAIWESGIVAFDPATGEALGEPLDIPADEFGVWSVSETSDGRRAVVTYEAGGDTATGVFDIASGERLASGPHGLEAVQVVGADRVIGVSASQARLYDLATLEPVSSLPRAIGGGQNISVSADGRTLLDVGWNNALTLYDLTAGIALGAPLRSELTSYELSDGRPVGFRVGGFLTADGNTLLERVANGIRVWDLRPAEQASNACALAGRELTEEEWSTYFPGEEQVATCTELGS
jgi:DNA-binding SARP family transcriptional activator